MIAGIFHEGSGIGNQLHRYVASRVLALDKGYEWGMARPELYKGSYFLRLDMGKTVPMQQEKVWYERKIVENGIDVRSYDPEINFVPDNTLIDGEFQDERYFIHRINEVRQWLDVEPMEFKRNVCVINFRGGEYTMFPDLFLPKEYWDTAIAAMESKQPGLEYEVHTDDPATASQFFPDYSIIYNQQISHSNHTNMGLNWRAIRYAPHLILSNTSFAILPALLNTRAKDIIAPRYWARRGKKVWATPQNYYSKFTYV